MFVNQMSVVVPVFNGAETIPKLVERLAMVLSGLDAEYEVILVNDGSTDTSWSVIQNLAEEFRHVKGIDLMRNYGQHNAVLCGVRAASKPLIITMDDDLQNPPEEISKLLDEMRNRDLDVVYGYPTRQRHGAWRGVASQLTKIAMQKGMGVEEARYASAFRLFKAKLREAFANYDNSYVSIDVLLSWGTTRFGAVDVDHDARKSGVTGYSVTGLITHALNMLTGFTTWPLRVASFVGFGFTLFGCAVLAFVLGRYMITGTSVPGFPFLASIIAIFSGAQLFSLGIIGEYLARMFSRNQGRPASMVRSTTDPTAL